MGADRLRTTWVSAGQGVVLFGVVHALASHVGMAHKCGKGANGRVPGKELCGKPLGVLEIPERPGSLAFGGADWRTLFIAARTSLYSIRTKTQGR